MKKSKFILIGLICSVVIQNTTAQHWDSLGHGTSYMYVSNLFEDTIAHLLYVSGHFNTAGGIPARGIASWNGTSWDSLGRGIDNYPPMSAYPGGVALCRYNNELYVSSANSIGTLTDPFIAHWDGTAWYNMPISGFHYGSNSIGGMWVYDNDLYVSGWFDTIGGIVAHGFAKWDGISWSSIGNLPRNGPTISSINGIGCTIMYHGELYIGGELWDSTGGDMNIERWNGTQWNPVGGGFHGGADNPTSFAIYNNELYVGGTFTIANGNIGNYIQKWNGTTWSEVGGGMNGQIEQLFVFHNELYAIGLFSTAGGIPADRIAKWDGTNWCGFGDTFSNGINAICSYKDSLIIGGAFLTINSDTVNRIAKWIGGNYTAACTTVGVEELGIKNEELGIWPNPCEGELRITNYELGIKEVRVYDVLGAVVVKNYELGIRNGECVVDVSGLAKGMYFVNVKNGEKSFNKKIIKE